MHINRNMFDTLVLLLCTVPENIKTFYHFQLSLLEIIIHYVSKAKFTAQSLSLSDGNYDIVRWRCGYKIRILLDQNNSLEYFKGPRVDT